MRSFGVNAGSGLALSIVWALGLLARPDAAFCQEPVYATVAILLPPDAAAFDNPVAVLFGGPPGTGGDDGLVIEPGPVWGEFSGADLINTHASYIAQGGFGGDVRLIDGPIGAQHGVMHLSARSDTIVELVAFFYVDGSVVRWESDPEAATGMIVIVTGRVH
jgi:hypothetical protein